MPLGFSCARCQRAWVGSKPSPLHTTPAFIALDGAKSRIAKPSLRPGSVSSEEEVLTQERAMKSVLPYRCSRASARCALASLFISACFTAFAVGPAMATVTSMTGNTTGAPTFQRPVEDLSGLSAIGTSVHYTGFSFTALASGVHTFVTRGDFDTFVLLYEAPFAPATPLLRALVANDELSSAAKALRARMAFRTKARRCQSRRG